MQPGSRVGFLLCQSHFLRQHYTANTERRGSSARCPISGQGAGEGGGQLSRARPSSYRFPLSSDRQALWDRIEEACGLC